MLSEEVEEDGDQRSLKRQERPCKNWPVRGEPRGRQAGDIREGVLDLGAGGEVTICCTRLPFGPVLYHWVCLAHSSVLFDFHTGICSQISPYPVYCS